MKLRLLSLSVLTLLAFSSCKDKLTGPPATTPAASDTIADWTFSGNLKDVTGNGHDGTNGNISDTLSYGPDRFGRANSALVLDGNNYVSVSNKSDINFTGDDSYTICFWLKTSIKTDAGILSKGPRDNSYPGYRVGEASGNTYFWATNAGHNTGQQSTPVIADGYWHMVTIVVTAPSTVDSYLDSAFQGEWNTGPLEPELNNLAPLLFGVKPDGSDNFTGSLDDIVFLNRALDPVEVAARFHEGGWYYHPAAGFSQGNFGTSQNIIGICFPGGSFAYACGMGGTILGSRDSGNHWGSRTSNTTEDLYRISFANDSTGLVGGNNGTLLRTTDAGKTWTSISAPFQTVGGNLENIRDLKFLDATHVMIVGGVGNVVNPPSQGFVMLSSDAGLTWTRQMTTAIGLYSIGNSGSGWANVTVVGSSGETYTTTDGGQSWNNLSLTNNAGDDFLAVDFSPVHNGWAVTAYGTMYNTSNIGAGWGVSNWYSVSSSLRTVKGVSVGEWWVAGDNGVILHTLNDGINWSRADINGVTVSWNDIVARDAHTLAFIGSNGTLYWYKY